VAHSDNVESSTEFRSAVVNSAQELLDVDRDDSSVGSEFGQAKALRPCVNNN
jgi:hypothetical protein